MNQNNLKLKHYLKIYTSLEEFPTSEDILYEICLNSRVLSGKEFDFEVVKKLVTFQITQEQFNDFVNFCLENDIIIKVNDKFKLIKER